MKRLALIVLATALTLSVANAGWWRTFGGAERDEGTCVQQTMDGGYIVTGVTWSFGRPHEADIWLIKLDSLGHKEWERTYEGGWGYSVRQTSDGGYVIAGHIIVKTDAVGDTVWTRDFTATGYSVLETGDENYLVVGRKSDSLWLMKISKEGDSLWVKAYNRGNSGCGGTHVEQTSDSGYIITGSWNDEETSEGPWKSGIWLLKTDSLGDTLWTKSHGGEEWNDFDGSRCVRQTTDGGYIIAGKLDGYNLIKTDSAGEVLWRSFSSGGGHCVEQTLDGGFIATGGTKVGTIHAGPFDANLWLTKTDANGDTVWTREYGGEETDAGRYVQQTTDSGYIVIGSTNSFDVGRGDLYLLKTDSLGLLGIVEEPLVEEELNWKVLSSISSSILLQYREMPHGFKASIFDVTGRKVDELSSTQTTGSLTWGKGFSSGVYFIRVCQKSKEATAKVVLVH